MVYKAPKRYALLVIDMQVCCPTDLIGLQLLRVLVGELRNWVNRQPTLFCPIFHA